MKRYPFLLLMMMSLVAPYGCAQNDQKSVELIRVNQVGYYPLAPKVAAVEGENGKAFFIYTSDQKKKVFTGKLSEARTSPFSTKKMQLADFTSFTQPGSYVIVVPEMGHSYAFDIRATVLELVVKASIKGFYYQRLSTSLPEKYAGQWHRAAGEPDNKVLIHPSAASPHRPEGTVIAASKGWFDAGDYNKYIVNSGITMGTLFSACEDFPEYYTTLKTTIPESNNKIPDLLDETLWNLRWMLTMQDEDGGVYNKLTNAKFDGMIMPDKATTPRYVVQKGTAATLDFAAVTAQAARIVKKYETELPGLSDSCLIASKKAWEWAVKNPKMEYDQNLMNKQFDPDISTGGYGDNDFSDEFIWAACELYTTTHDESYYKAVVMLPADPWILPAWPQVRLLGYYTLLRFEKELTSFPAADKKNINDQLIKFADHLLDQSKASPYGAVMGGSKNDFIWGSNSVAANQGIALIQTYKITKEKKYLDAALSNLDYLLGRNGTGYSYVTGVGDKTPMHPHHRPSVADGIEAPVPGLLAGGPNPGMQDHCHYLSSLADEAYTDEDCSYASNEIAINWNAPLVYLVGAMEALQKK